MPYSSDITFFSSTTTSLDASPFTQFVTIMENYGARATQLLAPSSYDSHHNLVLTTLPTRYDVRQRSTKEDANLSLKQGHNHLLQWGSLLLYTRPGMASDMVFNCDTQQWEAASLIPTGAAFGITQEGYLLVAGGDDSTHVTLSRSLSEVDIISHVGAGVNDFFGLLTLDSDHLWAEDEEEVMLVFRDDTCVYLSARATPSTNILRSWAPCAYPIHADRIVDSLVWQKKLVVLTQTFAKIDTAFEEFESFHIMSYRGPGYAWQDLAAPIAFTHHSHSEEVIDQNPAYLSLDSKLVLGNLGELCIVTSRRGHTLWIEMCRRQNQWIVKSLQCDSLDVPLGSLETQVADHCFPRDTRFI